MLRKTLSVLLMIVAGIGLLVCVAGLIGVWVANTPLTDVITTTLDTGNDYLVLAIQSSDFAGNQIETIRQRLDEIEETVANVSPETRAEVAERVTSAIRQEIEPLVNTLRATFSALRTGLMALNASLESANRIPGVNLPTLTDELQAIDQRLQVVQETLAEVTASLEEISVDGSRVAVLAASVSDELATIEARLNEWKSQLDEVSRTVVAIGVRTPSVVDLGSVALSLFFVLFGGGQLCLILRAAMTFRAA